ncbi:terminase small subunit [Endozoicomonas sp. Mp262]|uniref:terminase small subunit n=1 Tax=Endozoicomonas sp. Mp262 TaxID=2919499 RepID=UPI0021D9842A
MSKGQLVNKKQLAEIIGKSERTITTFQKNGLPIQSEGTRGTANIYNTSDVIDWLIQTEIEKYFSASSGVGNGTEVFDYDVENARLTHHKANIAALDEQVKEGKLIPADVVEAAWVDFVAAFRAKILGIPTKAAHQFLNLTDLAQIQDCLKEHLFEALAELADYDPEHYGIQSAAPCSIDGSAAA